MSEQYAAAQSWLFVPAGERFLRGIKKLSHADNIIFDLEDSLKAEEKAQGLSLLTSLLKNRPVEGPRLYVRLNRDRMDIELTALKDLSLDGYMIPKFEDAGVLDEYEKLLEGKKIAALVESPSGILAMKDTAGDERISAFALGGEDYCSALGVRTNDDALLPARSMLLLFAKAAKKTAIDTISSQIRDREDFRSQLEKSLDMGFDGKLMIHPLQALTAREMKEEIPAKELEYIIKEFEKSSEGAVMIKGKLYERPHIERLKKILKGE